MGKNKIKKSIISFISKIILHKTLSKYTNKNESIHFLDSEVSTCRDSAVKKASKIHWDDQEKETIKTASVKNALSELEKNYPDVKFEEKTVFLFAEKTIEEILG